MNNLSTLPDLVVQRIGEFLAAADYCRLRQTCRHLHTSLCKLKRFVIEGEQFSFSMCQKPRDNCPQIWFSSPPVPGPLKSMTVSMKWKDHKDQGFGDRKGQIWVQLLRGDEIIAEKTDMFGTAPHNWQDAEATTSGHNLIKLSKEGDFYRFMRIAGGGVDHMLIVRNFKATLIFHSSPACEAAIDRQLDEWSKTRIEPARAYRHDRRTFVRCKQPKKVAVNPYYPY